MESVLNIKCMVKVNGKCTGNLHEFCVHLHCDILNAIVSITGLTNWSMKCINR